MDEERFLYVWRKWDPPPPWVKFDDKMQRQFTQMEIKFLKMELDIQQQKLKEFGNIVGMG